MPGDSPNGDDLADQHNGNSIELRELVYQSLERDGLLRRLKAQLLAGVFKTIEKAASPSDIPPVPSGSEDTTGRICRALVLDWLQHSRLLYTQDVFKVESSGLNSPAPLTHNELLEQLHLDSNSCKTQSILHALLNQNNNLSEKINSLPDHIKQSIDTEFPSDTINDINHVREHFRSLFSSAFNPHVLDAFLDEKLSISSTSLSKIDYEQISLQWIDACTKVLMPQSNSDNQTSLSTQTQSLSSPSVVNNGEILTRARHSSSSPSESNSSSISTSSSENPQKNTFESLLPTTMN